MKMQRPFASGLQLMFTPEALIPFLIGTLALAVLGNAVYQLLTNYLGTGNMAVVRIGVGSGGGHGLGAFSLRKPASSVSALIG